MLTVGLFSNGINNSNCYVVYDKKTGKGFIIDPGSREIDCILELLEEEKLKIDYIILTHSHFDHIAGVGDLIKNIPAKIISSKLCSDKITDPVRNLSFFTDFGIIISPKADIFVEDLEDGCIKWNNHSIFFLQSPGHTKCSICVHLENMLFTGDTIIKGLKTKITYPDGNREELEQTLKSIYERFSENILVYPGHGELFILGSQDLEISLKK